MQRDSEILEPYVSKQAVLKIMQLSQNELIQLMDSKDSSLTVTRKVAQIIGKMIVDIDDLQIIYKKRQSDLVKIER